MKPYKFVLPLLAVAALGVSLPALAGQAEAYREAKKSEVKVGPVSVMNMVQAPLAPANPATPVEPAHPSLPYIKVEGIDHNDLQAVLNEALSFKGTDAEFAKRASAWKEKYGISVTRKGPGHIILVKGEGKGSTRVEIHRSGESMHGRRVLAPNSLPLVPGQTLRPDTRSIAPKPSTRTLSPNAMPPMSTEKSRTLAPNSRLAPSRGEAGVLAPNSRRLSADAEKQIEIELRGLSELKSLSAKDRAEMEKAIAEMRKSLKDVEGIKIILPDMAELSTTRKLTDKERAKLDKELAEVRKSIRIAPNAHGSNFTEIEVFGTTSPDTRVFRYSSELRGLSEADQKKMREEMAKVHADSQKKIEAIRKKYEEKAKKSAAAKK